MDVLETRPAGTRGSERTLILVKAIPRASKTYQETVCCAGVTAEKKWRRLFPVRFRQLADQQQFRRWQWLDYSWRRPRDDTRHESRRVEEDSIIAGDTLPSRDRLQFLLPLLRTSTLEAIARGESLAIIEPRDLRLKARAKRPVDIEAERTRYRAAAMQGLLFDAALAEMQPCPYAIQVPFVDQDGVPHAPLCEDWETSATFFNLRKRMGDTDIIAHLERAYTDRGGGRRVFLAMGTVKRRPRQWLLLGIIRIAAELPSAQGRLLL